MALGTKETMDPETISTLKTICIAGHANSGFNGDCNAQLEELAKDGLIEAIDFPKRKGPGRSYKATDKGRELVRYLSARAGA